MKKVKDELVEIDFSIAVLVTKYKIICNSYNDLDPRIMFLKGELIKDIILKFEKKFEKLNLDELKEKADFYFKEFLTDVKLTFYIVMAMYLPICT
jgi:hypothetical protein